MLCKESRHLIRFMLGNITNHSDCIAVRTCAITCNSVYTKRSYDNVWPFHSYYSQCNCLTHDVQDRGGTGHSVDGVGDATLVPSLSMAGHLLQHQVLPLNKYAVGQ